LREEQERAVQDTLEYAEEHETGEFLWNAKPRFGKTLSVYDFCYKKDASLAADKYSAITYMPEDGSDMVIKNISELITNKIAEISSLKTDRDEAVIRLSSANNKEQAQINQINNLLDAKDIYTNASVEGKKSVLHLIVKDIIVTEYDDIDIFLHI
jgi:hypothetical protein